eukprot:3312911-Alexandrium_andersonii.AAC.1
MLVSNVKRGPICKHARAVLFALAAEQCEKAEQSPAPSASGWIISPELRAELERPKLEACSAEDRGACEHPAPRAA